jgi:enoyl-CoA hydratase/carnithine racemase
MEVYRRDDCVNFSGGLADREFGHWSKTIAPGQAFETPSAFLTVVRGNFDEATTRLQAAHRTDVPKAEDDLPVIFNEWCTNWGAPTHDNLVAIADRLRATSPRATEVAKYMIHAAVGEDRAAMIEALGSGMIAASADKAEGVAAFRAKRKPVFGGQ